MLNKYILLIVGLVAALYVSTTNANGLCSCSCCDGDQCDPIYEGTAIASSCAQSDCITACKAKFEDACGSFYTTIRETCQETNTTTASTPTTTTTAYGLCSCYCCDGDQCNPIYEGTAIAPSCAQSDCITACKAKFEEACGSFYTTIRETCQEKGAYIK